MAMEVEDDVFFADLSRQIALLIMDDEEEYPSQCPPSGPLQGYYAHAPQCAVPPGFVYEAACRRESKGTGVFIPRSSCPTRRKSSRSGGRYSSTNKQREKKNHSVASTDQHVSTHFRSNAGGVLKN